MSFNYMNAEVVASFTQAAVATKNTNWFRPVGVVDVSGMEFNLSVDTTKAAASASVLTVTVVDGGATGELVATTAVLFATITNSPSSGTAWTSLTYRRATGTSATDLDADDGVNVVMTTAGTAASGPHFDCSYIIGKPAVIA